MNNFRPIRTFAVCAEPGTPNAVRHVVLTDTAQQRIAEIIEEQYPRFLDESLQRVAFDPTYSTDDESVLWISGFNLPEHIQEAIEAPKEIPDFSASEPVRRVKSMFYVGSDGTIFFQCWRHFEVMDRGKIWLFLSDKTFDVENETKLPLVLQRYLDAVFWDGDLYFKSYPNTSSMLEMLNYVAEATSEDIDKFVNMKLFHGDARELGERCSKLHRRQIRLLVQSNFLENQTVSALHAKAVELDYDIAVTDDRILIPSGGKDLTSLLHFLNDRIYRGLITGHTFVAKNALRRDPD